MNTLRNIIAPTIVVLLTCAAASAQTATNQTATNTAGGFSRGGAPGMGRAGGAPRPAPKIEAGKLYYSLKAPVGPSTKPSAQGFIQRWVILEPIRGGDQTENAVNAAVHTNVFEGQFTVLPKDGDKVTAADGAEHVWHAVETDRYNMDLNQFAKAFKKSSNSALMWAVTLVDAPEEMKDVRLAIGSNAASVWWLNGQEVVGIYGDRQTIMDDGVSKRVTLKKGQNVPPCCR